MGFLSDPAWTEYERRIDDAWKRGDRLGRERLYASPPKRPTAWDRAPSFAQCTLLAPFLIAGVVGTVAGLSGAPSRPSPPSADHVGTMRLGFPTCGSWLDPEQCRRNAVVGTADR